MALHLLIVSPFYFSEQFSNTKYVGYQFLVFLLDFPATVLAIILGNYINLSNLAEPFIIILSTLMYFVIGFLIGLIIEKFFFEKEL